MDSSIELLRRVEDYLTENKVPNQLLNGTKAKDGNICSMTGNKPTNGDLQKLIVAAICWSS